MALYSIDEICRECKYSQWHRCEKCYGKPSFCHCVINQEIWILWDMGTCESKELKNPEHERLELDLRTVTVDALTGEELKE